MLVSILTSKLFWLFVILNFVNVLVNTSRSLLTIKGGKWIASIMNAICYGYYTIIIVITATYEMPLIVKCVAVALVNFIGVFTIKYCEEKMQKDKLWLITCTAKVNSKQLQNVVRLLREINIQLVYSEIVKDELYSLQIFSNTQKESRMIKDILDNYNLKYCATQTEKM